jgi:uncharacterized protein YjbI with pentapeptide repeats
VPVVLAIGGYLFTRTENRATQASAERRAQDEAVQAYLDQMGQMLLSEDRPLRQPNEGAEARTLARARTLTVLTRVDGERKRSVMQFLYESNLIDKDDAALKLDGANLSGAKLARANLNKAGLSGANLREADLSGANLQEADLHNSDLRGADLGGRPFHIMIASIEVILVMAETNLTGANLRDADLEGANLRGANFTNATVTDEQLLSAISLEGATMPNGQKYENWRKEGHEDGENE